MILQCMRRTARPLARLSAAINTLDGLLMITMVVSAVAVVCKTISIEARNTDCLGIVIVCALSIIGSAAILARY